MADTVTKIEDYDQVPLEDATPEHIFFNYVAQAYSDFLAGADDFGDLQKELNEIFGKTTKRSINLYVLSPRIARRRVSILGYAVKNGQNEGYSQSSDYSNYTFTAKKNTGILEKTKTVREEFEQLEAELVSLQRKEVKTLKSLFLFLRFNTA